MITKVKKRMKFLKINNNKIIIIIIIDKEKKSVKRFT
jgi:hypothetical protein